MIRLLTNEMCSKLQTINIDIYIPYCTDLWTYSYRFKSVLFIALFTFQGKVGKDQERSNQKEIPTPITEVGKN